MSSDFAHPTPEFVCFVKGDNSRTHRHDRDRPSGRVAGPLQGPVNTETHQPSGCECSSYGQSGFSSIFRTATHGLSTSNRDLMRSTGTCSLSFLWRTRYATGSQTTFPRMIKRVSCTAICCLKTCFMIGRAPAIPRESSLLLTGKWRKSVILHTTLPSSVVGIKRSSAKKMVCKCFSINMQSSGGRKISLADVRVHELLLILHWLEESWREHQKPTPNGHGPEFYEAKLQSLFRRTVSCSV